MDEEETDKLKIANVKVEEARDRLTIVEQNLECAKTELTDAQEVRDKIINAIAEKARIRAVSAISEAEKSIASQLGPTAKDRFQKTMEQVGKAMADDPEPEFNPLGYAINQVIIASLELK